MTIRSIDIHYNIHPPMGVDPYQCLDRVQIWVDSQNGSVTVDWVDITKDQLDELYEQLV